MEALRTIGWRKALRFLGYQLVTAVLHWVAVPQFRVILMRTLGARIGSNTIIHDVSVINLYHYGFRKLSIGNKCFLGDEVLLDCRGGIILGDHVTISNRASIVTHMNVGYPDHPLNQFYPTKERSVTIKSGAYIGTAAVVLPGMTIGKESVVGAGAVVTKDVPSRSMVAGVPAKIIKKLRP